MDLKEICREIELAAKDAGAFIGREAKVFDISRAEKRGLNDFVSYVDKTAEARIVKRLAEILPEAGFITEEKTATQRGKKYDWIVDPLDGTTNFLHHIPLFSVSIGLMADNEIVCGVIYEPNLDECFYAWKDGGAYLNGQKIHVSEQHEMKNALLATGFPYYDYGKLEGYIELFTYFARHTSGLRRLGSAAVDLAYTACGRVEGFYEYGLHAWDVAAGIVIVKEAGGTITDLKGGNDYIFGAELLASNTVLHPLLLEAAKAHFRY